MRHGIRVAAATSILALCVTFCNVLVSDVHAQSTYYLSPTGSDALGDGSRSNPWASIEHVNTLALGAGDRVLLEGGAAFTGSFYFGTDDVGTESHPITVGSYGIGRATLYAGDGAAFFFYNTGGFRIQGIDVRGGAGGSTGRTDHGIVFYTDTGRHAGLFVDEVDVRGFARNGLAVVGATASAGYEGVEITNSVFRANGDGARIYGPTGEARIIERVRVSDSQFTGNTGVGGTGLYLGDGVDGATVQYNYFQGNAGAGLSLRLADDAAQPLTVRFNISADNEGAALDLTAASSEHMPADIFHNTFVGGGEQAAVKTRGVERQARLLSNLLVADDGAQLVRQEAAGSARGPAFLGNGYWGGGDAFAVSWNGASYSSLSAWRAGADQEQEGGTTYGVFADPVLTKGTGSGFGTFTTLPPYQIAATSQHAGAAIDIAADFGIDPGSRDFFGGSLAGLDAFSSGAHQPFVDAGAIVAQRIVLEVELGEGWNLVSSAVAPENRSLETIFGGIASDIKVVRDASGREYVPSAGRNDIGDWDVEEAYLVYAERPSTLVLSGTPLAASDVALTLQSGWNVVPYTGRSPIDVEAAIASLGGRVVLMKDDSGAVYNPTYSINTIGQLRPGRGYRIYVTEPSELVYPSAP